MCSIQCKPLNLLTCILDILGARNWPAGFNCASSQLQGCQICPWIIKQLNNGDDTLLSRICQHYFCHPVPKLAVFRVHSSTIQSLLVLIKLFFRFTPWVNKELWGLDKRFKGRRKSWFALMALDRADLPHRALVRIIGRPRKAKVNMFVYERKKSSQIRSWAVCLLGTTKQWTDFMFSRTLYQYKSYTK